MNPAVAERLARAREQARKYTEVISRGQASIASVQFAITNANGVGHKAHEVFSEIGFTPSAACKCPERIIQMNAWGIDGCIANKETIFDWWKESYAELSILSTVKASAILLTKSWFNPLHPYQSILDEAIRRARECQEKQSSSPT